jgi:hypothetical protein
MSKAKKTWIGSMDSLAGGRRFQANTKKAVLAMVRAEIEKELPGVQTVARREEWMRECTVVRSRTGNHLATIWSE